MVCLAPQHSAGASEILSSFILRQVASRRFGNLVVRNAHSALGAAQDAAALQLTHDVPRGAFWHLRALGDGTDREGRADARQQSHARALVITQSVDARAAGLARVEQRTEQGFVLPQASALAATDFRVIKENDREHRKPQSR